MKRWVFLSVFGLFLLTGCEGMGGGLIVDTSYTYSTPVVSPHASAYGRSNQYRYYYYPRAEFYFDTGRNMYFYLDSGSQWQHSAQLPLRLRSHLSGSYVEIEMDDDRPYRRHNFYKNKYRNYRRNPEHGNRMRLNNRGSYRELDSENREQYRDNQRKNRHQYRENRKELKSRYRENKRKNKHQYRENKRNITHGQKPLRSDDDYERKEH